MPRFVVGAVILGWMLACTGTDTGTADPAAPVDAAAPEAGRGEGRRGHGDEAGGGKARKGGKAKAGGRPIQGALVGFDMGDLMHLTIRSSDGEEHSFVCADAACSEAESWKAGTEVVVEHELRVVQINDSMSEEMEVVVSIERAAGGE